jgi:uncharacterized protein (DUF2267 family)
MQATQVESLERTIQHTNEWLKAIQGEMKAQDRQEAYAALRATLHVLRDMLAPDEAVQLGAQMPALVRGIYYEGWKLSGRPARVKALDAFLGAVAAESGNAVDDAEDAVRAVFQILSRKVSRGEIADVKAGLPREIRALWPE